jgi:hypothetical protein
LSKPFVGGEAVHADAQDLRLGRIEFSNISLICFEFLRSATGEREHVKCQDDIFLALETTE